ncbi:MAG TPA: hypothetical protein VIJ15_13545 [Dermatophilaceae bacterium]
MRTVLRDPPPLARFVVVGAVSLGVVGGIVGLIVGLFAYPPTAWFAVFEVGIPGAIAGAIVGLLVGVVAIRIRNQAHRQHPLIA